MELIQAEGWYTGWSAVWLALGHLYCCARQSPLSKVQQGLTLASFPACPVGQSRGKINLPGVGFWLPKLFSIRTETPKTNKVKQLSSYRKATQLNQKSYFASHLIVHRFSPFNCCLFCSLTREITSKTCQPNRLTCLFVDRFCIAILRSRAGSALGCDSTWVTNFL